MTIEDYRRLSERKKKELLVDAEKVAEREDEIATYELFRISTFYVEVSRSITYRFRKIINCYLFKDIPHVFGRQLKLKM